MKCPFGHRLAVTPSTMKASPTKIRSQIQYCRDIMATTKDDAIIASPTQNLIGSTTLTKLGTLDSIGRHRRAEFLSGHRLVWTSWHRSASVDLVDYYLLVE